MVLSCPGRLWHRVPIDGHRKGAIRVDREEVAGIEASQPVDFSDGLNQEYEAALLVINSVHDPAAQELTLRI
jgi:hypothetical protein